MRCPVCGSEMSKRGRIVMCRRHQRLEILQAGARLADTSGFGIWVGQNSEAVKYTDTRSRAPRAEQSGKNVSSS